jgi:hypothetical protein
MKVKGKRTYFKKLKVFETNTPGTGHVGSGYRAGKRLSMPLQTEVISGQIIGNVPSSKRIRELPKRSNVPLTNGISANDSYINGADDNVNGCDNKEASGETYHCLLH